MKKRLFILLTLTLLICGTTSVGAVYIDVPEGHWSYDSVQEAEEMALMQGIGDGRFGLGQSLTRSQFAAMLTRMFGWPVQTPEQATYADCETGAWYFPELEAAIAAGAVMEESGYFRPNDAITRSEMAVMLVCALGYDLLAADAEQFGHPFSDVTDQAGYITVAYDLGIITGKSADIFDPDGLARREEAAAMMVRVCRKYRQPLTYLHGFYAFSSWDQRALVSELDWLSVGWSRLEYADGVPRLNMSADGGNEWRVPVGYESAFDYFKSAGCPVSLNVYMSTSMSVPGSETAANACEAILLDGSARQNAVDQIMEALAEEQADGTPAYSGVTIDFEGMKGDALKEGFSAFLALLGERTKAEGKTLAVAVHPVTATGAYYDAYDYRAIGEAADKVILMAHDYQASSMSKDVMASGFTTTPVTPFPAVYYALRAITDPETGVADRDKIVLAVSFSSCGWSLRDGEVVNAASMKPTPAQIYRRLTESETEFSYSARYRNPTIRYYDVTDDTENIVWYENERSVRDKIELARMFGINGLSLWRIGLVPEYEDTADRALEYNVWQMVLQQRSK